MVGKCVTPCLSAVRPSKGRAAGFCEAQNGRVSCGHGGRDGGQDASHVMGWRRVSVSLRNLLLDMFTDLSAPVVLR